MPEVAAPNGAVATPEPPVAPASDPKPSTPAYAPDKIPGLMRRLLDSVPDPETAEPEKKPEVTPPEKPKAEAPAEPAKPVVTAEPEKPIALRKPKLKRPEIPAEAPKPAAAPEPVAAPKPDPKWEEGLEENEREMLSDARELEEVMPEKYKGFAARTEKFLRDNAARKAAEDFDEQDPKYQTWLKQAMPALSRKEQREFQEVRVANRVKETTDAKLTELKHQLFVRDQEPKIEQEGRAIFNELAKTSLPEDVAKAVKDEGYEKATATYKLELETAQEILAAATEDIKEFFRVSRVDPETKRALVREATDPSDPKFAQHERLRKIMDDVCSEFRTNAPQEQQLVNGKWFVTRDEWKRIPEAERSKYWTFNNRQIVDQAKRSLKGVIEATIAEKRKRIEGYGWTRAPKPVAAPAAATSKPEPTTPAAPRGTPIPTAPAGETRPEVDPRAARIAAALTQQ
jgi:hypothetical protein